MRDTLVQKPKTNLDIFDDISVHELFRCVPCVAIILNNSAL